MKGFIFFIFYYLFFCVELSAFNRAIIDWNGTSCDTNLVGKTRYTEHIKKDWSGCDNPNGNDKFCTDGTTTTNYYCIWTSCLGKPYLINDLLDVTYESADGGDHVSRLLSGENLKCDYKIKIYFANGMFNTKRESESSKEALEYYINLSANDIKDINITYDIAFNQNEPTMTQLIEVAIQERIDDWSYFFSYLAQYKIAPSWFLDTMQELAQKIDKYSYIIDADLLSHIDKYEKDIKGGYKVIVIGHSQGNFYANKAYSNLKNTDNFHIVSVATPANTVQGGGKYTTLTTDKIITVVRLLNPNTLFANTTNKNSFEFLGHSFVHSYMYGDNSREKIVKDIIEIIEKGMKYEKI